jgi:hypothetical protein
MFQLCAELSTLMSLIMGLTKRGCKSWGFGALNPCLRQKPFNPEIAGAGEKPGKH